MGFGVVIAKLRYLFPANALTPPSAGFIHASNLGLIFAAIGILTAMVSAWHYLVVQHQIRHQSFRASKWLVLIFSAIVVTLGLLILWYLLQGVVRPT